VNQRNGSCVLYTQTAVNSPFEGCDETSQRVGSGMAVSTTPSLDLNSFHAQHGRPALSMSGALAALAYEQAHVMALHPPSS
jgi:hypothetical protein